MKHLCAALGLLLVATPALAYELKPHWYLGASYDPLTLSGSDGGDFDVDAVTVKLGAGLHRFMAVEARAGFGVGDDTQTVLGTPVTAEIDQFYGAYLKGIIPLHQTVSLYGLAGYTQVEATASSVLGSESEKSDGFSYGAGLAWHFNRNVSINAEWMSYLDKDDFELDGFGLGANVSF